MIKIKKIIKRVMVLLLVCYSLQADKVDVTLREFADIVANRNHINILISSEIEDDKIFFYIADKTKPYVMLPAFKKMLYLKDLQLLSSQGFYYIDKIKHPEKEKFYHTIKLNNLVFNDAKALLNINKIESVYIKSTNSVGFNSTTKKFKILEKYIKDVDVQYPQIQFKINIFYTNIDNLKDRGFNLSAYKKSVGSSSEKDSGTSPQNLVYFLNLITMPYTASSNVVANAKSGFYATVKYLDQNGFTNIKNSPVLTARSHSKVSFSSVKNIPYLVSKVTNESTSKATTESLEYKDVGLKIDILPVVVGDVINFDLNLVIEDITSTSSLTPSTQKRKLNSSYRLKRGEILILSGVNRETLLSKDYGVPVLKNIWLLGAFFKFKNETKTKETLTISIEVL